jgi:Ferritin-like domain
MAHEQGGPLSDVITVELAESHDPVRRALDESHTATRSDFFKKAIAGGGALAVGGLTIGGLPSLALGKPSAKQDVEILNFALLLEYLESNFYVQVVRSGNLTGRLAAFATTVRDHELAHVKALKAALGSKAIKEPEFNFAESFKNEQSFIATSMLLEDTGVSAYDGQGPRLRRKTLPAAAAIVSVEARHAAWIRFLAGEFGQDAKGGPAPDAVNKALTKDQVTKAVQGTGFIKS